MPVLVPRGPQPDTDDDLRQVVEALNRYAADDPDAVAEAYRYGKFLIRVRVISPRFADTPYFDRHKIVWGYLEPLPEEVLDEVYSVILLTPEERPTSAPSLDFDHPLPARM